MSHQHSEGPGNQDPGNQDPGNQDPGNQGARNHGPGEHASGDGLDEQALRNLLQGAVGHLEPSGDALEQLRRAVPVRRTRRRQAVVGATAALILGATALPALIHVATTSGTADGHRANTASSRQHTRQSVNEQDGTGVADESGQPGESGDGRDARQDDRASGTRGTGRTGTGSSSAPPSAGPGGSTLPAPAPTLAATSPSCDRDQLGNGTGSVGSPDKKGRVYGAFRVMNVSRTVCSVAGPGVVAARAQGGAEPSRISVVDHTAGDAAPGLPDPVTEPSQVILQPGQAYEIKFAWVPAAAGGPSGCAKESEGAGGGGSASPAPAASSAKATHGAEAAPAALPAVESKPQAEDTGTPKPPGSVLLSHTPDAGEPKAADTTIPDACAGTIYRTGPLATAP
ncbi:hypothetical protein AB0K09_12110 [Streptomyces sp. NPDC049577]|uniref:hypothetical protein n=1 Tax=Streptomyces sp. NPDC049577 TaxID=3155153 RepID=UPI00342A62CA